MEFNMYIKYKFIVYKCTNIVNNKSYIGTTSRALNKRLYGHRWTAAQGGASRFHTALRKYDWSLWQVDIIYMSSCELDVAEKEELFISSYNTFNSGYNGNKTGKSVSSVLPLNGSRNHMYKIGNKHPLYNIPRTEQIKQKIKDNHQDVSGAANSRAKRFILTDPNNVEYIVDGDLQQFCDLHQLSRGCIVKVSKGNQKQHRGWTAICYGRLRDINRKV